MKTRRRFTRHILRITIATRVPRLTHTRIRPVGVEASPVMTGSRAARATGAFDHVFSAAGAGEARGADARVASGSGVVGYAASTVSARL